MKNKLAVITVNFNNKADTKEFIDSFKGQDKGIYKIFIVDVSDEKDRSEYTNTEILEGENKGYGHALNIGIKKALEEGYTLFACINNDTIVSGNFVKSVLKSLKDHKQSLIGGKIYYAAGYEYHKKYKKEELGKVLWYAGGCIDWKNVFIVHRGVDEVDKALYDKFEKTDFVTGCLMCFDKSLLTATGYFDETYFLYYEDADWNMRVKKNENPIYYDPSIVIWHKNSQSTEGSGSKIHVFYQEKNRLAFGLKYAPFRIKLHLLLNYLVKQ